MVRSARQSWEIGREVKVGFMALVIEEKIPTPGNYEPDAYLLRRNTKEGIQRYLFVPHNGLHKVQREEDVTNIIGLDYQGNFSAIGRV